MMRCFVCPLIFFAALPLAAQMYPYRAQLPAGLEIRLSAGSRHDPGQQTPFSAAALPCDRFPFIWVALLSAVNHKVHHIG